MGLQINSMITVLQAMQLVALAPCLFVVCFLLATARDYRRVVVPCLYFLALASSFLLPLLELWPGQHGSGWHVAFAFAQAMLPAMSFLLVLQFAFGRVPPLPYWGVLALPLIGGSGIVYAALLTDELCLPQWGCLASYHAENIYATVGNGFIFLLLMAVFMRVSHSRKANHTPRPHSEYWLIVALICLNLCVMAVGLWHMHVGLPAANLLFIETLLRMTFIYVVLTMLFRVFDARSPSDAATDLAAKPASPELQQRDGEVIAAFEALMQEQQLYREMDCNRDAVAKQLGISGNMLSRIINQHYHARFTDVVNQYRVREAQRLLLADVNTPVTDIAFEVGFNSIPSFNRVFKESTGFSPTSFRASRQPRTSRG